MGWAHGRVAQRRGRELRGKLKAGRAKKASHCFVLIYNSRRKGFWAFVVGWAHGPVARRRGGESRGKRKAGRAKKASHRFVQIYNSRRKGFWRSKGADHGGESCAGGAG